MKPTNSVSVRLDAATIQRLDVLARARNPSKPQRADVLLAAILRGLAALEQKVPPKT